MKVAIIVMSDRCSKGLREDESGKYLIEYLKSKGDEILYYKIIPDEKFEIKNTLLECADKLKVDLIITSGGTGLSPKDVTPQATQEVINYRVDGISEILRVEGYKKSPNAILSRGIAGVRGTTLIVNLPGSLKAVKESIELIYSALKHGIAVLKGEIKDCGRTEKGN